MLAILDNPAVRALLEPAAYLTPDVWAELNYVLPDNAARGGGRPLSFHHGPYQRGMLQACLLPRLREVALRTSSQVGKSTVIRAAVMCAMHQDKARVMAVLPDEDKGRKIIKDQWRPALHSSPAIAPLITGRREDMTQEVILLINSGRLELAWAGSSSAMRSTNARIVAPDEVDVFAQLPGEPPAIEILRKRVKTYYDQSKILITSTPVGPENTISRCYDDSQIKLDYWVPCPLCGAWQTLEEEGDEGPRSRGAEGPRVQEIDGGAHSYPRTLGPSAHPAVALSPHWPKLRFAVRESGESRSAWAERVEALGLAWIECGACGGLWGEAERAKAVRSGYWATEAGIRTVSEAVEGAEDSRCRGVEGIEDLVPRPLGSSAPAPGGLITAGWPVGVRAAMQLNDLAVLWSPLASCAADTIRAEGDQQKLVDLMQNRRGRPYVLQVDAVSDRSLQAKLLTARDQGWSANKLPWWGQQVWMACDVQQDVVFVLARAMAFGRLSRRCWHTMLPIDVRKREHRQQLRDLALGRLFEWSEPEHRPPLAGVHLLGIDHSYHGEYVRELYWQLGDQRCVLLEGGDFGGHMPFRMFQRSYKLPGRRQEVRGAAVWEFDSDRISDNLVARMRGRTRQLHPVSGVEDECDEWQLDAAEDDGLYLTHMTAEQKQQVKGGWKWVRRPGVPNHWWDCEKMLQAMWEIFHERMLLGEPEWWTPPHEKQRPKSHSGRGRIQTPDGRPYYAADR